MATRSATAGGVVQAPLWPALATVLSAVIAAGSAAYCLVVGTDLALAAAGYVIGCIGAVALASAHRALENKERSNPSFRLQPALGRTARIGMVLGICGGLVCAFLLATELAK